jgi:hypothetical protein
MHPAALAAHHGATSPTALIVIAIIAAAGYLIHCAIWPYRACTKCDGHGKYPAPNGRTWRYCRHCDGIGGKIRPGRRALTHLKNTYRHGTSHHTDHSTRR